MKDLSIALGHSIKYASLLKKGGAGRIPAKFNEQIILAVTAVNECVYCTWFHSNLAIESGCSPEEIARILGRDLNDVEPTQAVALAFAQHYAESEGKPDFNAAKNLLKCYGFGKTVGILDAIYKITIGNLTGNTLDAFNCRIRGKEPRNGSFCFEFLVFFLGMPLLKLLGVQNKMQEKFQDAKH